MSALLGAGWLRDENERLAYAYDNSRHLALPDAVALPVNQAQVQALVRACRAHWNHWACSGHRIRPAPISPPSAATSPAMPAGQEL